MIKAKVVLEKRYRLVSSRYSIKIRVIFPPAHSGKKGWFVKYYPTKHSATPEEFYEIMGQPKSPELKLIKTEVEELEKRANGIIKQYPMCSITLFEDIFIRNFRPINGDTKISELTVFEFEAILKRIINGSI